MDAIIEYVHITRFVFPRSRVIGDSQVRSDTNHIATIELVSRSGHVGLGAFGSLFTPLPPLDEIKRVFDFEVRPSLMGKSPFVLLNRIRRPRGGNIRNSMFGTAIDTALWDLQAQILDLPLYQLLGGEHNQIPAYASGLCFHLDDNEFAEFYQKAFADGFRAFKIKVGHPDLDWDLNRLRILKQTVGENCIVMVDANEAWSPKEAIRRISAYQAAGHKIYWVEDPCLRTDFQGLRSIQQALQDTYVNAGEYLSVPEKLQLLNAGAVDMLHLHGYVTDARAAGLFASAYGIPVSIGNTTFDCGIHIACSLPEVVWMEYAYLDWNMLIENPIQIVAGYANAPDKAGHGFVIADRARSAYAQGSLC